MQVTDVEEITKGMKEKQITCSHKVSCKVGTKTSKYRITNIIKGPKTMSNQHCFNIIIKSP